LAGAEGRGERRSSSLLRLSLPLAALAAFVTACGRSPSAPSTLLDGSPAGAPAVELKGFYVPAVLTRLTVTRARGVLPGSPQAVCLARQTVGSRPDGAVVTRIGVSGETVTFRWRSAVVACDTNRNADDDDVRWCGGSYGRLFGGRLRDPRLDIAGCRDARGDPVAFAWIEPRRGAQYVVIRQQGFVEVYPVAGGLPVRVATASGIESEPIGATFDVSEHDGGGRVLRTYRLRASPAG
jgi:hypothetical protein